MTANEQHCFDLEVRLLVQALYEHHQVDFRSYAPQSLRRRLRQALAQTGLPHLGELQHQMLRNDALLHWLVQQLTVQVSDMFRDPAYYLALRSQVVPLLHTYPSIKVWVAGCSQGEEAWSLAILLHEEGLLERTLLYATDINPQALSLAQAGLFPLERMAGFSANYLRAGGRQSLAQYFTVDKNGALVQRGLRQKVVFADHSLATDAVFSEVHLVSCRNVLIYFTRELQDRALGLLRDALVPRGFLGLGTAETLAQTAVAASFEPFAARERIWRKAHT